jgi:hypothetical protein
MAKRYFRSLNKFGPRRRAGPPAPIAARRANRYAPTAAFTAGPSAVVARMVSRPAGAATRSEELPELLPRTKLSLARSLGMENPDEATLVQMLVNPTLPRAGSVSARMETARSGPPRYDLFISTPGSPAFAFSAFRRRTGDGGFEYGVRMSPTETAQPGAFCAHLRCSADCTRYTLCDDPSQLCSYPRELGAVCIGGGCGTGNKICVLLPRVLQSGAAAHFRVNRPEEDGIIGRFLAGRAREHICALSGVWSTKSGGCVELSLPAGDGDGGGEAEDVIVFRAVQCNSSLSLQYSHPLSAYQAFCIALSLVHHAQHRQSVVTSQRSPRSVPTAESNTATRHAHDNASHSHETAHHAHDTARRAHDPARHTHDALRDVVVRRTDSFPRKFDIPSPSAHAIRPAMQHCV